MCVQQSGVCGRSKAPGPDNALLLQLFGSLPGLPAEPRLQYTAAMVLVAYSPWLSRALQAATAADLVPRLLEMLTSGVFVHPLLRRPSPPSCFPCSCLFPPFFPSFSHLNL
jgi:hypothetical protein